MNPQLNIDLHTHSTCSDGSLTPAELVAHAAAAGANAIVAGSAIFRAKDYAKAIAELRTKAAAATIAS